MSVADVAADQSGNLAPPGPAAGGLDMLRRSRLWRFEYRNETALFALILLTILLFPKSLPLGVWGLGLTSGCGLALQGIGVVLVYRSNRIINFAQVQIGATAAALFAVSVRYFPIGRLVHNVCPPCLSSAGRTVYDINFWVSMLLAILLSVFIAWLIYVIVVRRFQRAPRLVLTVATIFIAQGLPTIASEGTSLFTTAAQKRAGIVSNGAVKLPFDFIISIKPVLFHAYDVMTVLAAVAAAGGLWLYFRRSSTGTAIRGASENPDRAGTLGINVTKVTSRVWLFVGLLSAVGALLQQVSIGGSGGLGPDTLVEILAVAVIARLSNLPLAAIAAVFIGFLEEAVLWAFNSIVPLEGGLIILIAVALLLQRYKSSRAEIEQASGWQAAKEIRPIPRELRRLPTVSKQLRVWLVIGLVVVLGFPWVMNPTNVELGAVVMIYIMVMFSLLILTGWGGQISLGQFAFAAIGAYVAAVVRLPFIPAVLVGSLSGVVAALLVGIPALKLRGLHLAVITLALSLAAASVLLDPSYGGKILPATLGRPKIFGFSFENNVAFYYLTLVVLVLVVLGVIGLRRSRTGRALIAARDNDRSALSFGIGLTRLRLTAFAVSGFLAALAGALFAYQQHGVTAANFTPTESLNIFLFTVIGGLGTVWGPILGGVYFAITVMGGFSATLVTALTGFGGVILLMLFPGGFSQIVFGLRDAALRRIASRNRIIVSSLISDRDAARLDNRIPIATKATRRAGGFVPERYTLDRQWALRIADAVVSPGTIGRSADEPPPKPSEAGSFRGLSVEKESEGARG